MKWIRKANKKIDFFRLTISHSGVSPGVFASILRAIYIYICTVRSVLLDVGVTFCICVKTKTKDIGEKIHYAKFDGLFCLG